MNCWSLLSELAHISRYKHPFRSNENPPNRPHLLLHGHSCVPSVHRHQVEWVEMVLQALWKGKTQGNDKMKPISKAEIVRLQAKLDKIHQRINGGGKSGCIVKLSKWKKTKQRVVSVKCMCGCCSTRIWPGKDHEEVGIETSTGVLLIYRAQLNAILDL